MSRGLFGPSSFPIPTPTPTVTPTGTPTPSSSGTMAQSSSVPTSIDIAPATSTPTVSTSFPPCARSCLSEATSSLPCDESDVRCLCLHASTVQSSINTCLTTSGACSAADKTVATLYYNNLCPSLGYPTDSGSSHPSTTALTTSTGSPSAAQATAQKASSTTHANSLSVPAIAGIAAGAAFVVAAIITGLVFLYLRRRSQPDIIIVDSEKRPRGKDDNRPVSSRRSALFTLEPPSPPRKEGMKTTVYETELASQTTFDSRPTLTNNSYTWYNKKEAEISTTSLISMPRNLHTPIPKSPSVTEFSDVASICSATSTDVSMESSRPPSVASEAPPTANSKRQSRVVVSQHLFNPPKVSFSQPRPSTSHSTSARPPRLDLSKFAAQEEIELDDGKSDRRLTWNPLGQNPAPQSERNSMRNSMAFNFELPSPAGSQGFGDSFMDMGDFEKWKERR